LAGGIISGEIGIVSSYNVKPDFSIFGLWLIRSGDNKLWKEPNYKDKLWHKIVVPGNWENQGYKDYDGVAWYRRHFILPDELTPQKLVLVIGKIENYDEVYINGVLIGASGKIPSPKSKGKSKSGEDYRKARVYSIPENLLHSSRENTIAIKVYNARNRGGIVEGPIGFVKLANYNRYFREFGEVEP
jgi:Beta-galactosidase/beta-glucuronidase